MTLDLLRAIAAQAAAGRQLLVATTDLDKMRTVIWNLGIVAVRGGEEARRLFRDVIVASASIPGVFPPVLFRVVEGGVEYDEMHVDGGTTTALFIAPEIAGLLPVDSSILRGANAYVIVNGQFGAGAETTPVSTVRILRRSITAALQSSSRASVEIALSVAERNGMDLRVTEIPNDYPFEGPLDVDPARMRALFDFGSRCARQQQLWATPRQMLERVELAHTAGSAGQTRCPSPDNRTVQ